MSASIWELDSFSSLISSSSCLISSSFSMPARGTGLCYTGDGAALRLPNVSTELLLLALLYLGVNVLEKIYSWMSKKITVTICVSVHPSHRPPRDHGPEPWRRRPSACRPG